MMPKNSASNVSTSVEEAAVRDRGLAGRRRVRVEEGVDVPTIAGYGSDGIDAVAQHVPQRVRRVGARDAAAHPDDGDRLGARDRTELLTGLPRQHVPA